MACSQLEPQMNFTVFQLLLVFPLKKRYHMVLPLVLTLFLSFISLIFYKCKLVILTTIQLIFVRQSFIHCFNKILVTLYTRLCVYICEYAYICVYTCTCTNTYHTTPRTISPSYAYFIIQMSNAFLIL